MKNSFGFVVCINNDSYKTSLEQWKIYETLSDEKAEKHNLIRVIDESGEDYLYPASFFSPIRLPEAVRDAFLSCQKQRG
jgi:hypothetical protein